MIAKPTIVPLSQPRRISIVPLCLTLCWLTLIPIRASSGAQSVPADASTTEVRIGVLGLFHPSELRVGVRPGTGMVVHAGEERIVLEKSSGLDTASVRLSDDGIVLTAGTRIVRADSVAISGRSGEPVDFLLAVPDRITRRYHGTLEIKPSNGSLLAIVSMALESAVASIVAAESTSDTPLEAAKAQAVAARSYLVAGRGRHQQFDFCDTTHCQFLREPPEPGSVAGDAVTATRGLVLAYDSKPFAAMYTRSCSGRTHTPADLGLPSSGYPYYPAECAYCRAHPASWSSKISARDAATLRSSDESSRLNVVRRLGWSAVPSNTFTTTKDGDQLVIRGTGQGHGIGLCQAGARALAEQGETFQQILSHYFPNTTITTMPSQSSSAARVPRHTDRDPVVK